MQIDAATVTQLVIVTGRPALGQGLRMRLSAEPDLCVVGEALSCSVAVDQARILHPDVVLVEFDIVRANEAGQMRALATLCRQVPVIILTLHDDAFARRCMERVNAAALIGKLLPVEELVASIRQVSHKRLLEYVEDKAEK